MPGRLYVCATPIGNLEDASARLIRVLKEVDAVAAEDTRHTQKLLTHYSIGAKLISYHDQNERTQTKHLIERLKRGDKVALVSDSGTPSISDPGFQLIRACIEARLPIEVIPGPTAAISALVVSGLPTSRFSFEGFLSKKEGERRRRLERIAKDDRTLVFYEAPGRVAATLREILEVFGDRAIALARELTKIHEEVIRGRVSEVLEEIGDVHLKGEVVIVVAGAEVAEDLPGAVAEAKKLIEEGLTKAKAAAQAAASFGVTRRQVYDEILLEARHRRRDTLEARHPRPRREP